MTKTYTHEQVTYGAKGRRWEFTTPNYSYSTPLMPLGRVTADKVARIINGSIKRSGTMDELGRANLHTVFHKAAKAQSRIVHHLDD
jgi:hypothetical protein